MAELAQRVRDHGSRRRLAVRPADDDRAAQRDELGEELGARTAFDPTCVRSGDDDLRAGGWRRLAADLDVDAGERIEKDRLADVPASDLRPPRPREVRVRGEPGAADADEVEASPGERLGAHR